MASAWFDGLSRAGSVLELAQKRISGVSLGHTDHRFFNVAAPIVAAPIVAAATAMAITNARTTTPRTIGPAIIGAATLKKGISPHSADTLKADNLAVVTLTERYLSPPNML